MKIIDGYYSKLSIYETQTAIGFLKKSFEKNLIGEHISPMTQQCFKHL